MSVLERVSLQNLFCMHLPGVFVLSTLCFSFQDLAHGDVLKPACTQSCIGQIHSSVASIGMSMYRACKW